MKRRYIILTAVLLSCFIGVAFGVIFADTGSSTHSHAIIEKDTPLEEILYDVDLVIKGTVDKVLEPQSRDAGINDISYVVTPALININEVLYGSTPEKVITYLQHGAPDEDYITKVKEGEEYILFLVETDDRKYWSFNFEDGIWKIEGEQVKSKASLEALKQIESTDYNTFISTVEKALENKRKSPYLQ